MKQFDSRHDVRLVIPNEYRLWEEAEVHFLMEDASKNLLVNDKADYVNKETGEVVYRLREVDTMKPGCHKAVFRIDYGDGTTMSFPQRGYIAVKVERTIHNGRDTQIVEEIALKVSLIDQKFADLAEEVDEWRENVADDVKEKVYDNLDIDRLSNKEVIDARGGKKDLNERITDIDEEIISHIADKKNPHGVKSEDVNVIGRLSVDAPSTAYPVGVSVFDISGSGWPSTHGTVMTVKINENRISQYYFDRADTVANTGILFRSSHTANGWGEFYRIETTAGAQAKVDAHANNKNNPHGTTKAHVGLSNVPNWSGATQAEARAGTNDSKIMTPLRTKESIDTFASQATIIPALSANTTGIDYPLGLTTFMHSNLGYPTNHGTILNIKVSNLRFTQWYFPHSIRHEEIGAYFRHFYDGDGWTDWQKVATYAEVIDLIDEHAARTDNPHKVTSQQVNIISPRRADIPGSDYPTGVTLFSQTNGLSNGYPENLAVIVTDKVENYRMVQTCYRANGDSINAMWLRKWRPDLPDTGWSDWEQIETASGAQAKVDAHASDKSNPHGVTKAQVGLSNVDNAKQATKAEFDAFVALRNNPHNVTKSQVGLGNVQNYPVASQAQAEAGTHTGSFMTPQRTKQAFSAFANEPLNWIRASLQSTWSHSGSWPVRYAKDSTGTVYIEGSMNGGAIGGDPAIVQFTLPPGYRPGQTSYFWLVGSSSGTTGAQGLRCYLGANGNFIIQDMTWPGATQFVAVNIVFKAGN
ncbi:hypothetical protein BC8716_15585 [Shouchella clausii]|nr:pyocin knob domain-containing protein [Shouchella clausii]AST98646.1 hypothetical protein BC8716_15585 [Shouchella clausii]MCR1287857.1 pyocin knob domain-containing protein [Shouchella clausii]MCY1106453.1 pyocin knob domain-containing protein [Shouchella clausii]MEB5473203.1 pyocin knob domain-containing protein [Shouchella clausii]WQG97363.1 pyocin knob domain-containing protein [Shouchella clausii]